MKGKTLLLWITAKYEWEILSRACIGKTSINLRINIKGKSEEQNTENFGNILFLIKWQNLLIYTLKFKVLNQEFEPKNK